VILAHVSYGQVEYISIGKRANIIRDRTIDSLNLGLWSTNYYNVFYKIGDTKYKKIGAYGKNIYPHLDYSIKNVNSEFYKFRKNKIASHILLGSSIAILTAWAIRAPYLYMDANNTTLTDIYIKNKQFLFLIGYSISISSSMILDIRGDKKIVKAIDYHNRGF